jgi:VanZ family protein
MRLVRLWLPVVLWSALILSAANDRFSGARTGGWIERLFGSSAPELNILVRKSAHLTEYGILALLAWRASRNFTIPMLVVLAVASTDEYVQSWVPSRTGQPSDVLLDLCGAAIALLLLTFVRRRISRRFTTESQRTARRTEPL